MKFPSRRILILVGLLFVSLIGVGTVVAQTDTSWCVTPAADGVTPQGCAQVTISPVGTLVGDYYLGETLLATAQNPGKVLLPLGSQQVKVKNIVSTEPGFGTLFIYNEATAFTFIQEGKITNATVYPTKKYIRGTLRLTCDIRNTNPADPAEQLGCQVMIDTVPQPDILPPGGVKDYILDPGPHTVVTTIVGTPANLWSPATVTQNVNIVASATPAQAKPLFQKSAHLVITLSQPGVVGDIYVDGVQVATQVAAFDLWVAPNKTHKVDVKAVTDPLQADLYHWKDGTASAYVTPGQEKPIVVRLTQEWFKGFIEYTCNVTNYNPAAPIPMTCLPVLDGVPQAPVTPGVPVVYTVPTGAHKIVTTLEPAVEYGSTPVTGNPFVSGGKTVKSVATLTAKIPTFDVTVVNNSYTAISNLYIYPPGGAKGTDKLGFSTIAPGTSKVITVEKGTWSLYATNSKENPLAFEPSVTIVAPYTFVVNGPYVDRNFAPGTLTVVNGSPFHMCALFMVPLFMDPAPPDPGPNWLGPGEVIAPGARREFLVTQTTYLLGFVTCEGLTHFAIVTVGVNTTYNLPPAYTDYARDVNMPTALLEQVR
jgi:hypothetical protein